MKIEIEAVEGDRAQLYQWDLNRRLILTGFGPDTQAHFAQGDSALVVAAYEDGGILYADIPNICLQRAGMLYAYIYSPSITRTRTAAAFSVWERPKPEDYVYTETETLTYQMLEAKIGDLDNLNTKDKSSLVAAINEALKTGGGYDAVTYTEQTLTDAQQAQARKNIGALGTAALTDVINDALALAKESGVFDGAPGDDGADGITPTIGDNGNWYLGDTDTGKPSRGETGPKGDTGAPGDDGADGKSAYQYAQDGGYTGTEEEFAEKMAKEMPDKLPNPNALIFTGAVEDSYDGSEPLTVEIPSGGDPSEKTWTYLGEYDLSVASRISFTDLSKITEIYLIWEDVKNGLTTASSMQASINGCVVAGGIIPVNTTATVYGWSYLVYNGLYWDSTRSVGYKDAENVALNSSSSMSPNNHVLDVGPAQSMSLYQTSAVWGATSGTIKIYVR